MNISQNPILNADSYKLSHFQQYPSGTTRLWSYISARGVNSKYEGLRNQKYVISMGIEAATHRLAAIRITADHVEEAKAFCEKHGEPFNYDGWMKVVSKHRGALPIRIWAVPDGTRVGLGTPMVAVDSTDEELFWLVSWVETQLLRDIWYPTTVATISHYCRNVIKAALEKSSSLVDEILPFKLHDFGFRGVSSYESAAAGAAAHLISFSGTDTIAGIGYIKEHYATTDDDVIGFSIPASEHSTMTIRGPEHERESYQAMIDAYAKPGAIFAVVCDSYDLFAAVENIWINGGLFDQVKERGATVVIRPDSGNPLEVPVDVIRLIAEKYGCYENAKGYKVLPDHVRVIQGDGINVDSLPKILENLMAAGFSAENIGFGMGGGLLQDVNRDTFGFAMKASAAMVDGKFVRIQKKPATDSKKVSLSGIVLPVYSEADGFAVRSEADLTFDDIRAKNDDTVFTSPIKGYECMQLLFADGACARVREQFSLVRARAAGNYAR